MKVLVFLFAALSAAASPAAGDTVWDRLERAASEMLTSSGLGAEDAAAVKEIQHFSAQLKALSLKSEAADSRPLPDDYVRSLDADAGMLREALKTPGDAHSALADVRDDLRLKLRFAEGGLGFAGGFPAVIKVTVETVRAGRKVDGLWVRCNPRRFGVNKAPAFVFNSASSPTTTNLPPGIFVLWVESPDGKVLGSQPVEIGSSGSDSETIRFALP